MSSHLEKSNLLREITPLTQGDCFTLFSRIKKEFDFPLHYHEEFELNFIEGAKDAKRIVGDSIETVDDIELVLVAPNLIHGWFTDRCSSTRISEITIQFHRDLFDDKLLQRNQMSFLRSMFERSQKGIRFAPDTILAVRPRLIGLQQKNGFDSVLELMSILHDLSTSRNMTTLSGSSNSSRDMFTYNSARVDKIMEHLNKNFENNITLREAARIANMSEVAFSRFFKNRTGKTFIDTLNEIRLGHASRMLIDTAFGINEIAYKCGFNNISNFNRIFKKKKVVTPKQFRSSFNASGTRTFV